jgi:hypothetical protein
MLAIIGSLECPSFRQVYPTRGVTGRVGDENVDTSVHASKLAHIPHPITTSHRTPGLFVDANSSNGSIASRDLKPDVH